MPASSQTALSSSHQFALLYFAIRHVRHSRDDKKESTAAAAAPMRNDVAIPMATTPGPMGQAVVDSPTPVARQDVKPADQRGDAELPPPSYSLAMETA